MGERGGVTLQEETMWRGGVATAFADDLRSRLLEVLVAPASPRKMTYDEFLAWANEDTLAEWVDGEVVMYSPAPRRHQGIADFLTSVMHSFVEQHNLGVVLSAPFQMKLEHGREPDLLFVASGHLTRLKETYLDGPADLVIEIISPESVARDRGQKFYEYAQGGVREYWLIDPQVEWIEFYRLGEAGFYETVFSGREGVYHSEVLPGFWLRVEWLWQKPLPAVEDVLLEVGGETYARRWIERVCRLPCEASRITPRWSPSMAASRRKTTPCSWRLKRWMNGES